MKDVHIIAMSPEELDLFMENDFKDLTEQTRRAIGTMMLLCTDYVDFIADHDLWEEFINQVELEQGDIH
tara:strand:+ start:225 stop:431 length:207 start_codon:yes stop_codon:yes gene_type:complete